MLPHLESIRDVNVFHLSLFHNYVYSCTLGTIETAIDTMDTITAIDVMDTMNLKKVYVQDSRKKHHGFRLSFLELLICLISPSS